MSVEQIPLKEVKSRAFVLSNCFARDPSIPVVHPKPVSPTYVAEEKTVDYFQGESRRMVEKDYPVTSEYVSSFVELTDYKSNASAFLPPRQNLGDVREAQKIMEEGGVSAYRAKVQRLQSELNAAIAAQKAAEQVVQNKSSDEPVTAQNEEVKENG